MVSWMLIHSACPSPSSLIGASLDAAGFRGDSEDGGSAQKWVEERCPRVLVSAPMRSPGIGTEQKRDCESTSVSWAHAFAHMVRACGDEGMEQWTERRTQGQTDTVSLCTALLRGDA